MSLQRRSSHTDGCLFILFTVVILMVCSAPVFENNEKLAVHSPVGRHIIPSFRLSHPAESSDFNSETSQYRLETFNQPTNLDDSLEEDKINTRKKKHAINRSPERRLRKLVKRSEEKEDEKSEEYEKSKEVDGNVVEKLEGKREEKDEDKEDDEEGWGVKSGAHPAESDSTEQEAEKNGISPVKGPYLNISGSDDKLSLDDESSGKHDHTHTFRNWEEYLQYQKDAIRHTVSNNPGEGRGDQRGSFKKPGYRPVIHSDDHFRFIDKLFKAKNDKVKAFHALVLYMKQQGKSFKIPQRPTKQTTANPGSSNELGMGSTEKPSE